MEMHAMLHVIVSNRSTYIFALFGLFVTLTGYIWNGLLKRNEIGYD